MLKLLLKGVDVYQELLNQTKAYVFNEKEAKIFKTIKLAYQQQDYHFKYPKVKIKTGS